MRWRGSRGRGKNDTERPQNAWKTSMINPGHSCKRESDTGTEFEEEIFTTTNHFPWSEEAALVDPEVPNPRAARFAVP